MSSVEERNNPAQEGESSQWRLGFNAGSIHALSTGLSLPAELVKIPKFSGKGNVEEFVEELTDIFTQCQVPANLQVLALKNHLTGRALEWFKLVGKSFVTGHDTDFTTVTRHLKEAFPPTHDKTELEIEFYAVKQQRGTSLLDFLYRKLFLAQVLKLTSRSQELIKTIIARTLPEVADFLDWKSPTTTSQLLNLATEYENRHGVSKPVYTSPRREEFTRPHSPKSQGYAYGPQAASNPRQNVHRDQRLRGQPGSTRQYGERDNYRETQQQRPRTQEYHRDFRGPQRPQSQKRGNYYGNYRRSGNE